MYTSIVYWHIYIYIHAGYAIAIYFIGLVHWMLSRCNGCQGKKRVMGMGCDERDCLVCKGVGWVTLDVVVEPVQEPVGAVVRDIEPKSDKRSRHAKRA